jgi:tRNA pseudouridine13 synthase
MGAQNLPYLTDDVPGIGGTIRTKPEDFRVIERPLYLPCGQGEHLYVRLTKKGVSTPQVVTRLSSWFGIKARSIGVAGLKDAQAVTTQMMSLQGVSPERIARVQPDGQILAIEVLGYHRNRLRTGHHAGNHFQLVVRGVMPGAESALSSVLAELVRRGVPNYFGPQRQGRDGQNYQVGALLLENASRRAMLSRSKRMWYLNAYQSFLFNQILAARLDRIDQLWEGDWAMKHDNGACFQVEDASVEQPRADRFEISPTAPLFGSRTSWASGEPGALERGCVEALGTTPDALVAAATACGFRGERRPLRVKLEELDRRLEGRVLTLSFSLPPGSYATSVLREVMKGDGL